METLAIMLSALALPALLLAGELTGQLEVTGVMPGGASERAGIKADDILLSYDDKDIHSQAELAALKSAATRDSVEVRVKRGESLLTLRLPKGSLGVYVAEILPDLNFDPDARVIPGIARLRWGIGRENTFMGALETVLLRAGVDADYTFLCGVSGAAFRTHFSGTWCPSSPEPGCGFDATVPALAACGWTATARGVSSDGKDKPQITQAITAQIDSGRPVLAIDLIQTPEWGVIAGYQKAGQEFICRTYFDKRRGYELAQKYPFVVVFPHPQGSMPDKLLSYRASYRIALENLTTEKYGEYYSGLAAFDRWLMRLQSDDFTKLDSAGLSNVVQANYWILARISYDRKTARDYLARVAQAIPADKPLLDSLSGIYAREVELIDPAFPEIPCPGTVVKAEQWTPEMKAKEVAVLTQTRELESQALEVWRKLAK